MNRDETVVDVHKLIHVVREQQVILDSDLATLYGTTTSAFNQAVRRNVARFPESFRFQLTKEEYDAILAENTEARLTSQNVISKVRQLGSGRGGRRYLPYAFTEEGVAMLASVLRSGTAVQTSVHIVRSFVEMRHFVTKHEVLFEQIKSLELKQLEYQRENDKRFAKIFDMIEGNKCKEPMQKLFFEGQIYDAHSFLVRMIRKAEKEIILVDGYVNINTLDVLKNKKPSAKALVLTLPSSNVSANEIKLFNRQYPTLELVKTTAFHDRFMIFDRTEIYHIGASLKDAGEKCFAIARLSETEEIKMLFARIDAAVEEYRTQPNAREKYLEKKKLNKK